MTGTDLDWQTRLEADGYVLLPAVLEAREVGEGLAEWDEVQKRNAADPAILTGAGGHVSGARNLLRMWPGVVGLVRRPGLLDRLAHLLGPEAGVVRALFFDKPPGNGWALPWHKDYNVAVRAHGPTGRFSKPTTKAGVPHVEAPIDLLERMVTVRVHLDEMTDENGPLRVIPGSHRNAHGADPVTHLPVVIRCRAGDVLLIRPLVTHASGHCDPNTTRHRRIVHLECAPSRALPDGYEWFDFVPLPET
ncbi:MAG: hypothetical protein JWO38_3870 [Gemmataceae bacterium]|nr:hypothetical protein [Gemmataceae bacterium]